MPSIFLFLSLLVCTYLPHSFSMCILCIFFCDCGGELLLFQMRKTSSQNSLAIKIVTTVMLNEIVHIKCLVQCLIYGRLLVNQQCLFTLFKPTVSFFLLLFPPLYSPLPSSFPLPSTSPLPPSSPNYHLVFYSIPICFYLQLQNYK